MTPPRELEDKEKQLHLYVDLIDPPIWEISSLVCLLKPDARPPFLDFWKPSHQLKFCTSRYDEEERAGEQFITAAEIPSSHRNLYMNSWAVVDAGLLTFDVQTRKITIAHESATFFDLKGQEDRATTRALLEKAIRESPHLARWTIEDRA